MAAALRVAKRHSKCATGTFCLKEKALPHPPLQRSFIFVVFVLINQVIDINAVIFHDLGEELLV